MKTNFILFAAFLGSFSVAKAQESHLNCGHDKALAEMWAKDPQAKAAHDQLLQRIHQGMTTDPVTQKVTYIVPVVFHIMHEYGYENISDAQVYDAVNLLNADFRKQNADISDVEASFAGIAADVNVEFRLATIDPEGNCTNGIEHIYSHETIVGDNYSRLNQWSRDKYMNIWVFRSMGDGISGTAFPPNSSGLFSFADGIGILHSYTGSMGTGSTFTFRGLTHEVGHFLGLSHPWGSTAPETVCGDDGIADTPETKGFTHCPSTAAAASVCDPSVVENYQNFMDMSFCQIMFTANQAQVMRSILEDQQSDRGAFIDDDNLAETGVLISPAPLCAPVADFSTWIANGASSLQSKFACEGDLVKFKDASWNAATINRTWYFEDGTPATSTAAEPEVTFTGLGWKRVKLVVSNTAGADSVINWHAVHLSQSWADKTGPYSENFESGNVLSWLVDNPENNYAMWQLSNTGGKDNSKCMKLNNYKNVAGAPLYSEDYFYNFRMGGNRDILISPSNDLTNTTGSELIFDYAYATSALSEEEVTETLEIYISKNCGKTWTLRETLALDELLTASQSDNEFIPASNAEWKTATVPMVLTATDNRTRFKFEFNASDAANNLYLDNIRVTGVLDVTENPLNVMDVTLYPNPANASEGIIINYTANESAVDFQLMDAQGKVLATETDHTTNAEVTHQMNLTAALAAGVYYVKISQGQFSMNKKVVVM